jgi:hypothetical protein
MRQVPFDRRIPGSAAKPRFVLPPRAPSAQGPPSLRLAFNTQLRSRFGSSDHSGKRQAPSRTRIPARRDHFRVAATAPSRAKRTGARNRLACSGSRLDVTSRPANHTAAPPLTRLDARATPARKTPSNPGSRNPGHLETTRPTKCKPHDQVASRAIKQTDPAQVAPVS